MLEEVQILPSKIQVDAAVDSADKNKEKNLSVWFNGRRCFGNDGLNFFFLIF